MRWMYHFHGSHLWWRCLGVYCFQHERPNDWRRSSYVSFQCTTRSFKQFDAYLKLLVLVEFRVEMEMYHRNTILAANPLPTCNLCRKVNKHSLMQAFKSPMVRQSWNSPRLWSSPMKFQLQRGTMTFYGHMDQVRHLDITLGEVRSCKISRLEYRLSQLLPIELRGLLSKCSASYMLYRFHGDTSYRPFPMIHLCFTTIWPANQKQWRDGFSCMGCSFAVCGEFLPFSQSFNKRIYLVPASSSSQYLCVCFDHCSFRCCRGVLHQGRLETFWW